MFAIFGIYSFRTRLVAYQPVPCKTCGEETLAVQSRSFKVAHGFWIPILPLGFIRIWRCSVCGEVQRQLMRQQQAWLAAGFMGALMAVFAGIWAFFPASDPDHALFRNVTLLFAALVALFLGLGHRSRNPVPDASLTPTPLDRCVLCGGALQTGDRTRCSACGAERLG